MDKEKVIRTVKEITDATQVLRAKVGDEARGALEDAGGC